MREPAPGRPERARPVLLQVLAGVVLLEAVAMMVVAVLLLLELLTQPASSIGGGVAIVVIAVLAAGWLLAMFHGTIRGRAWVRGAVFTWQLVQLAIAVGSFQGAFARPDIGWILLLPALVAIALLFTPSVMNATRRT